MKFKDLGLRPELCAAVEGRGYREPTPIQAQTIPSILAGKDVLGGAQTGTGKTAAFALPMLQLLEKPAASGPRALILTPTRELAEQVAESFIAYGRHLHLKVMKIYGGVPIKPQIRSLVRGIDIVVATPGRLLDHVQQRTIDLSNVEILVLDEADRMLDMGFINDIRAILRQLTNSTRQTLMFSATYAKDVEKLALNILNDPVRVEVAKRNAAADDIRQSVYFVDRARRLDLLVHLIREGSWYQVLIFVRTKHGADRLAKKLNKADIPSAAIHGDKKQGARTRALENFKTGDLQALIATDIAARGIDLVDLSHVVNFDLPLQAEDYVHRIGRTGRAGKSGDALSFVMPEEAKKLSEIERVVKIEIPVKTVAGFEPSQPVIREPARSDAGGTGASARRSKRRTDSGGYNGPDRQSSSGRQGGSVRRKPGEQSGSGAKRSGSRRNRRSSG
jgi:ATP-dependent RNA helicase RhlE